MRVPCRTRRRRRGFGVLEMIVVSGLMVTLVFLLSMAWTGLGRPAVDVATHCRLAQEAKLALASLSRDLGGYLSDSAGRLGKKTDYPFVGRLQPGNTQLWLCFDGGTSPNSLADWGPPDRVITYALQGNHLIRTDQTTGVSVT